MLTSTGATKLINDFVSNISIIVLYWVKDMSEMLGADDEVYFHIESMGPGPQRL